MTTGNFTDWNGTLTDLGPIYPFVGWEWPMAILLIVIWIAWHVIQLRKENRQLEDEAAMLRQGANLQKALQEEHTLERM
jgi:hypothetical protein